MSSRKLLNHIITSFCRKNAPLQYESTVKARHRCSTLLRKIKIFPLSPDIGGSRGNYSDLKRENALSPVLPRKTLTAYGVFLWVRSRAGYSFSARYLFRLCHRKRWIYAKIFFCGLTRKIQERQAFCERAYLESMKTSKTRSILQNFSVKNQPRDGTEPLFITIITCFQTNCKDF